MTELETLVIEDLYGYLEEHESEIDLVILQWGCKPCYAVVPTNNVGYDRLGGEIYLSAMFRFKHNDPEYSFVGTIDQAIDYIEQYDQWNGHEFEIQDGVLMGKYWSGEYQLRSEYMDLDDLMMMSSVDIEYLYPVYWDGKRWHTYLGKMARSEDEGDERGMENGRMRDMQASGLLHRAGRMPPEDRRRIRRALFGIYGEG